MNRVDRLLGYLLILQGRKLVKARDLAERFEISERTVYRDMQALNEVGVPLLSLPGEGYRLMEGYYLPPVAFTPEEARSLYLAVQMLAGATMESPTRSSALTALDKIRAVLPLATLEQVEVLQRVLQFFAFPYQQINFDDQNLLDLQRAIHEERVVRVTYHAQSSNTVTHREIEPNSIAFINRVWLLTGYCRLRSSIRHFRLDRMDKLEVLQETFRPREAELQERPSGPIEVNVLFEKATSRWVGERQHYSFQEAEDLTDGTLMKYSVRDLKEMASWLMQWAPQFRVVTPPELRGLIRENCAEALKHHADSA